MSGYDTTRKKERPMIRIKTHTLTTPAITRPAREMTRIAAAHRRRRWRPVALLSLGALSLALVVAGCGSATGGSSSSTGYRTGGAQSTPVAPASGVGKPAVAAAPAPKAANTGSGPAAARKPTSAVPQNNGGDSDPDNNGGPDDGDGGI
jgi:hypothetical protein